jgi:hypothetical protein
MVSVSFVLTKVWLGLVFVQSVRFLHQFLRIEFIEFCSCFILVDALLFALILSKVVYWFVQVVGDGFLLMWVRILGEKANLSRPACLLEDLHSWAVEVDAWNARYLLMDIKVRRWINVLGSGSSPINVEVLIYTFGVYQPRCCRTTPRSSLLVVHRCYWRLSQPCNCSLRLGWICVYQCGLPPSMCHTAKLLLAYSSGCQLSILLCKHRVCIPQTSVTISTQEFSHYLQSCKI